VDELVYFGEIVLVVAVGFTLALLSTKLTQRVPVPSPAIFLAAAALASDLFPSVSEYVSVQDVERIAVVALIVILFDGGMDVGWRRFRAAVVPISLLGIIGTFATAAVMAAFAQIVLGVDWTTAWISVLGDRDVSGRSGTILEGESGVNDPVGIALMIGVLEFATADDASAWTIVTDFSIEMAVGLVVGIAGAAALVRLMRVSLPSESLYPLRTLLVAAAIYGAAAVLHGSGFLAVFVAGLLVGDVRVPYKAEIERFQGALASLAEITVFVALGLTIDVTELGGRGIWRDGLVLALLLAFVARPLVAIPLILPARLTWGERLFVAWGGLKGAVPILLAAFALLADVDEAERLYGLVFVVVAFSVLVQGTTIPYVAPRLGVTMDHPRARPDGAGAPSSAREAR
jgi:cell volume regulation protein A